jgi:hypothetical protein
MKKLTWRAALCAGALSAFAAVPALASTVTFDDVAPNLFVGGDSFVSGGFTFTLTSGVLMQALGLPEQPGFAIVDTAAALANFSNAPTGNPTRFYGGLNDNAVTMTAPTGLFSIDGFDFAFIPPLPTPGASSGYLLAAAWFDAAGSFDVNFYDFGLADVNGVWAFLRADTSAPDFGPAMPSSVRAVTFVACSLVGNSCTWPLDNQGQFALDNFGAQVPLPGTWLLAGLGLAGLAATRRRVAR